jgi:predicted RNase H-like nuclease (RuvC/YqgF family)
LLFQPWVDAFNSGTNDMYGIVTAGLTYYLKSDRDKKKIEVDPNKYDALKLKADSAATIGNKLNRQSEKVATLEMSNQEKDMQIELLNQSVDSLKTMPRTAVANYSSGNNQMGVPQRTTSRQASTDLGATMWRVVIVSSPSEAGAQKFIDRSRLNKDYMQIAYIEKLDTYRVIYKSASTLAEAKDYRTEAREYYSDAWVAKF